MKRRRYTAFLVLSIMMLVFTWACGGGENAGGGASPAASPAANPETTPAATPAANTATTSAEGGSDTSAAAKGVSIEDAQKLYLGRCKACHGEDGKGIKAVAPEVPDFTDAAWHAKEEDKELYDAIANGKGTGKGAMPKWSSLLKPEEIQGLVGYVRSLKK
ncbi:MAG: c-type cytochrome [Acidobacteria bacterium]|nr:c-type cytochrome [Acidobacteriota bacterium]